MATSNDADYIDEWYDDVIFQNNWEGVGATLVNVTTTSATDKNFQLMLGRTISGVVTGPGGVPLEGVEIVCVDAVGDYVAATTPRPLAPTPSPVCFPAHTVFGLRTTKATLTSGTALDTSCGLGTTTESGPPR